MINCLLFLLTLFMAALALYAESTPGALVAVALAILTHGEKS